MSLRCMMLSTAQHMLHIGFNDIVIGYFHWLLSCSHIWDSIQLSREWYTLGVFSFNRINFCTWLIKSEPIESGNMLESRSVSSIAYRISLEIIKVYIIISDRIKACAACVFFFEHRLRFYEMNHTFGSVWLLCARSLSLSRTCVNEPKQAKVTD